MRHPLRLSAAVLSIVVLGAACGGESSGGGGGGAADATYPSSIELASDIDRDAGFEMAFLSMPPSYDPIASATGSDLNWFEPVYDRLLTADEDGELLPMLAEEWTVAEDNKSVTLTLKQGVTFSDGTPFDAEAVKFNLERAKGQGSRITSEVAQIDTIEVIDPHTVKVNVTGALGPLLVAFSARAGLMVSPAAAQAGTLAASPVGTGPYLVTAVNPGASAGMERNPEYWDEAAQNVATMTYRVMTDDQARLNALTSGELDGAQLNPDQMPAAERAGLNVVSKPSSFFIYFGVNTSVAPFDDPEALKALNMSIDREAISQGMYDGHCTPQIQPFLDTSPGYSDKIGDGLEIFPYDPEEAKKIIDGTGVTDISITTVVPNVTIYQNLAEVLQAQLAEVGITVQVKPVPPVQVLQEFGIEKTAESVTTPFTAINDPDALVARYLTADALFNPGGSTNEELLTFGAEGANLVDPEERAAAYEKMMDVWVEEPPHIIPICMIHQSAGYQPNASGISQTDAGRPSLRTVAISAE